MSRPRRTTAAWVSVVAALLTTSFVATGGNAGATTGPGPSRPGRAKISFLHETRPVSVVGARSQSAAAATAAASARQFESEILRIRAEHEGELGSEEQPNQTELPHAQSLPVGSGAGLIGSFDGLNHFDNRYSDSGNQFSGEPPDQALCVNKSYVLENVNSVLQVYTPGGKALVPGQPGVPGAGPVGISVNQFFGLPTSFDRTNFVFGPFVSDPECLYDRASGRWIVTSLELDLDPSSAAFTGPSSTLIAVSATGNPLGRWNVWSIDTTNNGTNGTKNHHCSSNYCFGDYPQIGIDANGLYITTNEFDNLGDQEFHGAQLYAISKQDLVNGVHTPSSQYFQNVFSRAGGGIAYTLEPVNALPQDWDSRARGTMYFGESTSPLIDGPIANRVSLFALSNTQSLNDTYPNLMLRERGVGTESYSIPALARQKDGPSPLTHCVNLGTDCIGADYPHVRPPMPLDGSPGKFYGAWLQGGTIYLTTATGLAGKGAASYDSSDGSWKPIDERIGVAYFALRSSISSSSYSASLENQGYVAVANANLTYPSVAVAPNGHGVIGFTLAGPGYYPSAAYATFGSSGRPSSVEIGGAGVGPYDGDSATGDGGYRPRWGDYTYSVAAPNGTVWVGAEYVNQQCKFAEFSADSTCGNTRSFYANWGTRIMHVRP